MRAPFAVLLMLGFCSAVPYCYGQTNLAAKASAVPDTSVQYGIAYTVPLRPSPNQRQVRADVLLQEPTLYAVTLPVRHDKDCIIRVGVNVNPKTHSIQKIEAMFAPLNKAVTYRQFGEGIGRFDAPTGRYYFNADYQTIRKLPNGYTDNGALRQITGWVEPGTSKAAIAEEVAPVD
jgi:hypothetical protein